MTIKESVLISVFQDHTGAGMCLLLELQKQRLISTEMDNTAPFSQCWLSVRDWGWHCSLQVSNIYLSKPVGLWGQGRLSLVQGSAAVLLPVLLPGMWARETLNWYLPGAFYHVIFSLGNALLDTLYDFICGLFPFCFSGWGNSPLEELENTQVSF